MAALARAADEDDFQTREAVYEKKRLEMQYQFKSVESFRFNLFICSDFRNSPKDISQTCRSFFVDFHHLANHFSYLSRTEDLIANVKKNIQVQIGKFIFQFCL